MKRTSGRSWSAVFAVLVATTTAAAQDDEEAEGFRNRPKQHDPIPATPDGLDARYEGAVAARRIGDVDTALGFYDQILKTDPKALSVHIAIGTAHWEKGDLAEAEKWLVKALEINPKQIKARQFLGQLRMQSGRFAEAIATFDELLKLEHNLDDVVASAHLNLGRIALVKRKWADAERHFKEVGRSPERGDRASAAKGLKYLSRLRKTAYWNREQTPLLDVHFSPKVDEAKDAAWRKAWVARRERALTKMYEALGWSIAEAIPLYVYKDHDDAYEISDFDTTLGIRYSWWLVHTLADAAPGRELAVQVCARVYGSRPASVPLVEGLVRWFDDSGRDRHEPARKLARAGKLRDLVHLHAHQREDDGMNEAAESFVAFAIGHYGLKPFLASYRNYNLVMLDTKWISGGAFRWKDALSEVFKRGLGASVDEAESKWRASLK
jgi:tetratricopeptide (TPR) repeat protein